MGVAVGIASVGVSSGGITSVGVISVEGDSTRAVSVGAGSVVGDAVGVEEETGRGEDAIVGRAARSVKDEAVPVKLSAA